MERQVYMDNASTTQVLPEVAEAMKVFLVEKYGNPSAVHFKGEEANEAVENSKKIIAKAINAQPEEIIFTSGATEANNLAINGVDIKQVVTSKIEHSSTLNTVKNLNCEKVFLEVDKDGFVDLEQLKNSLKENALVTIVHANHEIGTIQDINAISEICKGKNALLHLDASQSFTKIPIDVKNIDLMTINSHKIHGPKGIGALFVKNGVKISKIMHGGEQENDLRPGTENVPGIVGFAKAVEIALKDNKSNYMKNLRDKLTEELLKIPDTKLNGSKEKRLCNNVNITFKNVEGEAVLRTLSHEGIAVSTGSACTSKTIEPSHVLTAIGLIRSEAHGSIRYSLSKLNTEEEISFVVEKTRQTVEALRKVIAPNVV